MKLICIKWHYFEARKILESEIQQKQLVQQGRDETPNSESIQPYMYSFLMYFIIIFLCNLMYFFNVFLLYLVQFSVNYNMPFFDVSSRSSILLHNFLSYSLIS